MKLVVGRHTRDLFDCHNVPVLVGRGQVADMVKQLEHCTVSERFVQSGCKVCFFDDLRNSGRTPPLAGCFVSPELL